MKPCRKNLKLIASLALGDLESGRARELRQHFDQCAGCRGYFVEISGVTSALAEDAASAPEIELRASFHADLLRRLEGAGTNDSRGYAQTSWPGWLGIRGVAWSAAMVLLLAGLVWLWNSHPADPVQPLARNTPVRTVPASKVPSGDFPDPTEANYMAAANRSLDELGKLLDRESRRGGASAVEPVYTAFSMPPDDTR